eukprot:CAMPEP_0113511494 /NCGR_PEP_ID=MMETSP0014_2-20120614/38758_1 /TAXON_ID=2857 /ORGANISM="Nitzschia sp." /LENGTH=39 /DNA_ID=CAMNT_0000407633 /DNA_START=190 /DNA_END=306 /DNA_ORIENTATION=+ /assembly_acc=CAM_ASM_000159
MTNDVRWILKKKKKNNGRQQRQDFHYNKYRCHYQRYSSS